VDELAAIGLALGADVPVFVRGCSAHARGIGELLEPLAIAPAWYAVIHPGVAVATGPVFQAPELTRNSPIVTIAGWFAEGWPERPLPGRNDLEPVVAARHAPVRAALEWLGRRCESRLTGSGACVFGAFASERAAVGALDGLPQEWTGWVVAGLARSPLEERLERERRHRH
jgi:4-diphosphocytidyl-2-C-methyl-D-erythritol kinase